VNAVELFEAMLTAMEAKDASALEQLFDPEVIWWPPKSSVRILGLELPIRGREVVASIFAQGPGIYQPGTVTDVIQRVIGEIPLFVVVFTRRAVTRTGAPYETEYCFVVRSSEGKMAEIWEYCDTVHVFEQLGDAAAGSIERLDAALHRSPSQ
jgi:ketosteroid isomerase-like protein